MTLREILLNGGGILFAIMSIIQIAPIKLNPWSAILGWIGKQINGDISAKLESVKQEVETVKFDVSTIRDENRAVHAKDCRVRILRFSDEIYLGTNHSQEHFKQILGDITHYEQYCKAHPEFENQIAVAAIAQIKETYNQRLMSHDFLK